MGRALDIELKVIPSAVANPFVRRVHYSGKVVNNSTLHFGAFLDGRLHGVMSFGSPTDKRKVLGLVEGTPWNGMMELNRMAFDDFLPRNSESRAIGMAMRLIKKNAPHVKWVLSFADGCQCGDGTIYRASNFVLTGIARNDTLRIDPRGGVIHSITAYHQGRQREFSHYEKVKGFQLRYIYFIDKKWRKRLTVPEIPFAEIDRIGAGMYKGQRISRSERHVDNYAEEMHRLRSVIPREAQ